MATINVYDKDSGLTKTITIDVSNATVNGSHQGRALYYVTVSTTAKDVNGKAVPTQILTDGYFNSHEFGGDISLAIQQAIVNVFRYLLGEYDVSSSSQSSNNSQSSQSRTSLMSSSSSSTQHKGTSSSKSSSSSSSHTGHHA